MVSGGSYFKMVGGWMIWGGGDGGFEESGGITYRSIFFLISPKSKAPLLFVATRTSDTSSACEMVLRVFMIRTIAAWVS